MKSRRVDSIAPLKSRFEILRASVTGSTGRSTTSRLPPAGFGAVGDLLHVAGANTDPEGQIGGGQCESRPTPSRDGTALLSFRRNQTGEAQASSVLGASTIGAALGASVGYFGRFRIPAEAEERAAAPKPP